MCIEFVMLRAKVSLLLFYRGFFITYRGWGWGYYIPSPASTKPLTTLCIARAYRGSSGAGSLMAPQLVEDK